MKRLILVMTTVILFTGCEQEVQTVEWYKEHDAERLAVVRECKENPDKLNKTPNCVNAKRANTEILTGKR
ncbi:MAG: EexN family lipoprotein [Azoarcus sp.]|jgi:PBP1b-binding outer membrane lipoprotein LpoB|nr:EexN family lipoprotein [Azoarcus sp.]